MYAVFYGYAGDEKTHTESMSKKQAQEVQARISATDPKIQTEVKKTPRYDLPRL